MNSESGTVLPLSPFAIRHSPFAIPATVLVVVAAGCQSPRTAVEMWIVQRSPTFIGVASGSAEALSPEVNPRRAKLAGAINETLSFRFAVRAYEAPIKHPGLRIAPLVSTHALIDPSVLQVFRMHRVPVGSFPGWHIRSIPPHKRDAQPLGVLVPVRAPRGGLPGTLAPGETYYFWVDVAIPKGTSEGTYATEIELTSGPTAIGKVNVHLTVWPIVLPDESDIPVIAEVDHRNLLRHQVQPTLQMLQSHRVTPVLHKLAPTVKVDAHGEVAIDWGQYDAIVAPCLNGRAFFNRVPLRLWPMPFHAVFSSLQGGGTVSSPRYTSLQRQYFARCAGHFEQKGWLERSYAMLPNVTAVSPESVEATRTFAAAARGVEAQIALASQLWPQDMAPYGWVNYPLSDFSDAVDIWLPPAQFYDVQAMANQRAAGRRTWLAVDRPPFSGSIAVSAPATYVRVLTWQADQLGAEAIYLGCINRWPEAADRSAPQDCVRADPNVLLYPGGPFVLDQPVASVRLKDLRRSLQDGAYRRLLNEHDLEHVTATLQRSLAPYAGSDAYRTHFADGRPIGWVDDPALFDLARDIMAEQLISASYGDRAGGPVKTFAKNAAWRRFMLATRTLQINVDGTRIRLRGTRTTWEADIECTLTILNRTRVPVAGTVRFVNLPEGWTAGLDGQPVTPITANGSRRVTLTARATGMATGPGGSLSLPIEFTDEEGTGHRCEARACFITAAPFDGLIRIDGDLSDWPPGAANVASDFRLIAGEPAEPGHQGAARPHHATLGFIMRCGDYLYVAINCERGREGQRPSSPGHSRPTSHRNAVDYDDLVPVGGELVEILIDPFNTGTRSPADLYHIAVKPSGTYVIEKGIRLRPPCGQREAWPADIDVATAVSHDRWVVELRIPLASFENAATEHTTWGFNITRYDASSQEFSTWSGASGNALDPMSLGNLYLP